jgi:hypothetical protein
LYLLLVVAVIIVAVITTITALSNNVQGLKALIDLIKDSKPSGTKFPKLRYIFILASIFAFVLAALIYGSVMAYSTFHNILPQTTGNQPTTTLNSANTITPLPTSPGSTLTVTHTPFPTATPSPTATSAPTTIPSPTATSAPTTISLPTGQANCSGGQNVGWNKWTPQPAGAWVNNGTTIVNIVDTTVPDAPTLSGPPCGLLKRGSSVTIAFKATASGAATLYLMVQGSDLQGLHWYSVVFNQEQGLAIQKDGYNLISTNSSLTPNQSYTFTMEMTTDGNVNLIEGNADGSIILQQSVSFIPNGQWGLGTFYGSFSVSSVSVH